MEVASLSKMSIDLYHATRLHIPKESGPAFKSQRRENLQIPPRATFVKKELCFLEFQIVTVPTKEQLTFY